MEFGGPQILPHFVKILIRFSRSMQLRHEFHRSDNPIIFSQIEISHIVVKTHVPNLQYDIFY